MSVNFFDGVDLAEALLPHKVMKWLVRAGVTALALLLWSPWLSTDQVGQFLADQGAARAEAILELVRDKLLAALPDPPASATTTVPPPGP